MFSREKVKKKRFFPIFRNERKKNENLEKKKINKIKEMKTKIKIKKQKKNETKFPLTNLSLRTTTFWKKLSVISVIFFQIFNF